MMKICIVGPAAVGAALSFLATLALPFAVVAVAAITLIKSCWLG